jgi:hypothetical protein
MDVTLIGLGADESDSHRVQLRARGGRGRRGGHWRRGVSWRGAWPGGRGARQAGRNPGNQSPQVRTVKLWPVGNGQATTDPVNRLSSLPGTVPSPTGHRPARERVVHRRGRASCSSRPAPDDPGHVHPGHPGVHPAPHRCPGCPDGQIKTIATATGRPPTPAVSSDARLRCPPQRLRVASRRSAAVQHPRHYRVLWPERRRDSPRRADPGWVRGGAVRGGEGPRRQRSGEGPARQAGGDPAAAVPRAGPPHAAVIVNSIIRRSTWSRAAGTCVLPTRRGRSRSHAAARGRSVHCPGTP